MPQKAKVGTPAVVREMEGTKTTGRSQTRKMAKRLTTPDLHLSQRKLKKIQPLISVLQANMLLSPLMVKMKMREITPNRPLHSVLSPSLSPPWNIQEQIKPLSRQDKIKLTISKKKKKQRHYFANKGPSGQGYGFSSGHVWM